MGYDVKINKIIEEEKTLFLSKLIELNVPYKTIFRISAPLNEAVQDIKDNPTNLYPLKETKNETEQ